MKERNEFMTEKLYDQIQRGFIENEFVESFVVSVKHRLESGLSLTERQQKKLDELFERY